MTGEHWDHDAYCARVEAEVAAFSALTSGGDPAAPVPTCPGWTLADLVRHLGGVHRWAGGMVRVQAPRRVGFRELNITFPPEDGGLPDWYAEGGAALVAALRAADPATPVWTWGPGGGVAFWARRMVHETAVHRCDAAFALGGEPEVAPEVAADGIAEFLVNLPAAAAFAPKVEELKGEGETLAFAATDLDRRWTVRLEPGGLSWKEGDADAGADASVHGDAAALYLFLWGRRKIGEAGLTAGGDRALLEHWKANSAI